MEKMKKVYIIGTYDTKSVELDFVKTCLEQTGVNALTIDVSTQKPSDNTIKADVSSETVFPEVYSTVYSSRGDAISKMGKALKKYILKQNDVAAVLAIGGSGGTSLVSYLMKSLPVGLPKIIVSTMASGDIRPYIGASDVYMVYSITDIKGINAISTTILSNAAHAISGMIINSTPAYTSELDIVGISMFGVTTPCANQVVAQLESNFDCLVFHATGVGGQSMEKLIDSGYIKGVIDLTTTEIADHLMGGVLSAGEDRLGAIIRSQIPYVGSVGALDMVNFGALDSVPQKFKDRNLYVHNEQVTLMRTNVEENIVMGKWLATKLNQMEGEVRFILPMRGVSAIDVEGQSFYNPKANTALFETLEQELFQTTKRKLIKLPFAINDKEFSEALVKNFYEIRNF
ncbi:Tm-1-like ATP-binding domain-containing protein [Leeuwenhoekiella sp. NPDC079379]|uniref:Tm-1-like ATP-binding domain-containing protein n=1 Tax=Leeuwenhoekiella sp. NPDC079379 TaxID=3364122 RepID=UPI0037C6CBB2